MKHRLLILLILLLTAPTLWGQEAPADAEPSKRHPRLLIKPQQIVAIREAIDQTGSHHERVVAAMRRRVDQASWQIYGNPPNAARAYLAREAATLNLITDESSYAQIAYDALKQILEHPEEGDHPWQGDGLDRANAGLSFALVYDWSYRDLSDSQRKELREVMVKSLDAWEDYGHSNFGDEKASHWNGVCRSAELLMLLAAWEETNRRERFDHLVGWLDEHIANGYGPTGWSQEGVEATHLATTYLVPAVLALRQLGNERLDRNFNARALWKLAMYAGSSATSPSHRRRWLQWGVSPSTPGDSGFASALLATVPEERLAHYRWYYDRTFGTEAPGDEEDRYDAEAAGSVWSLLFYPTEGAPADPSDSLPVAFADQQRGAYFFRSRWQDSDDILFSVMADSAHNGRAWDQPEVMQMGLIAYGVPFIGGPAKQRDARYYSTLLIDGKPNRGGWEAERDLGRTVVYEPENDGGYLVISGGEQYGRLGVNGIHRHVLVDYSARMAPALITTLDRIRSGDSHLYTWQLNIGDDRSDAGLKVSSGREGGRPYFLIQSADDVYLKGYVLHPADAVVKPGDPLRIETRNKDADVWVVMLVGHGARADVKIEGEEMQTRLAVGKHLIRFDKQTGRIVSE